MPIELLDVVLLVKNGGHAGGQAFPFLCLIASHTGDGGGDECDDGDGDGDDDGYENKDDGDLRWINLVQSLAHSAGSLLLNKKISKSKWWPSHFQPIIRWSVYQIIIWWWSYRHIFGTHQDRPAQVKGKVNDSLLAIKIFLLWLWSGDRNIATLDDDDADGDDGDGDGYGDGDRGLTLTQRLQSTTLRLTNSAFTFQIEFNDDCDDGVSNGDELHDGRDDIQVF